MDPHSQNVGTVTMVLQQIYDPLIQRTQELGLAPGLALRWEQVEPTRWRFWLRPGVKFHEGQDFVAEDVVFSITRAQQPTSNYGIYVDTIERSVVAEPMVVDVITRVPDPILPNKIASLFIMSRSWSEQHNATRPQNTRAREEMHTTRATNGTGAFRLQTREPDVRTVMVRNTDWWGWNEPASREGNITEIIYRPISSDATRIAALLSNEIDFVLDPPLQDLNRLRAAQGVRVLEGPEVRTIFLAMDVFRDQLLYSDVRDRNPLKDLRVRQALYHAIDIQAIHRTTMRGQSVVTGTFFPPQVNGYTQSEDVRLPYDQARARALLTEAGYPNGFGITLDCPNNRYINDEQICQAIVAMWGARRRAGAAQRHAAGAVLRQDPARRHQHLPAGLGRADAGCAVFLPVAGAFARWRAGQRHLELRALFQPAHGRADRHHGEPVGRCAEQRDPRGAAHLSRGRAAYPAAPPDDPLGDAVHADHPAHGEQPALFPLGADELNWMAGAGGLPAAPAPE
jgi:peptide/nickel transport system substrate-binding protein